MNQTQAAALFGISQPSYSQLEAGKVDAALSTLAKAAEITGLSPAQLLAPTGPAEGGSDLARALEIVRQHGFVPMPRELVQPFQGEPRGPVTET